LTIANNVLQLKIPLLTKQCNILTAKGKAYQIPFISIIKGKAILVTGLGGL
jgi:hypothetical protein